MHSFLSNLTAALLALHTVLGCCWHHAHACTRECGATPSVQASDCRQDRHVDGHGPGCSENHGHHGLHECQGSTCVYLGPTKLKSHESTAQPTLPAAACVSCGGPSTAAAEKRPFFAAGDLTAPLRLHLVHHVLLL